MISPNQVVALVGGEVLAPNMWEVIAIITLFTVVSILCYTIHRLILVVDNLEESLKIREREIRELNNVFKGLKNLFFGLKKQLDKNTKSIKTH
jgi:hypothetical protein